MNQLKEEYYCQKRFHEQFLISDDLYALIAVELSQTRQFKETVAMSYSAPCPQYAIGAVVNIGN